MGIERGMAKRTDEVVHLAPGGPRRPLRCALAWAVVLALTLSAAAVGQTFVVLHNFVGQPTDGTAPLGGLLVDSAGNVYGTTLQGGKYSSCHDSGGYGCGIVFKLDTHGVETVLHNFNGSDGAGSSATLIMDAKGDLYGTAAVGGGSGCNIGGSVGCGVVFQLSGDKETVLYRFTGGADGAFPWAGLVMDDSANLYGTTNQGGAWGGGVAFKVVGKKETVLHSFCSAYNCKDGDYLTAGSLIMDNKGNFYGTAVYGGDPNCNYPYGCGVVFKLTGRKETVLHSFKGPDGAYPVSALSMDASGDLFGTASGGGKDTNGGTVFKVGQDGKLRVLHNFRSAHGGSDPQAGVVRDAQGNLYGTTLYGGSGRGCCGTVFEITADGKERVLHSFCTTDCLDGAYPLAGLAIDAKGNLYGTASAGGINRNGTVFMITPEPSDSH